MVLEYIPDIQIFECYYSESVYEPTANLVNEIGSTVSDLLMDAFNYFESILSLERPFRSLRELSLNPS